MTKYGTSRRSHSVTDRMSSSDLSWGEGGGLSAQTVWTPKPIYQDDLYLQHLRRHTEAVVYKINLDLQLLGSRNPNLDGSEEVVSGGNRRIHLMVFPFPVKLRGGDVLRWLKNYLCLI